MTQSLSRKSESAAKSKSNAGAEDGEELGEPRGCAGQAGAVTGCRP